jgi:hypothetical protein
LPIGGCEQSIFLGWRVQLLFDARAQISRGAELGKCASAWPFISRELTRFDAEDGRTCSARPLLPWIIEGPRSDVDAGSGNRSCGRLCGDRVVLVEQTAEAVTAPDLFGGSRSAGGGFASGGRCSSERCGRWSL